jgi:hypothetical protein
VEVGVDRVEVADAVEFVLEPLRLDRPAVLAAVEVGAFLLGRVAGGDDEPVAVRPPVELAGPLLERRHLPGVTTQREVEQPHLLCRVVAAASVRFVCVSVTLLVVCVRIGSCVLVGVPVVPADTPFGVGLTGRQKGQAVAVGAPRGAARAGDPRQSVRVTPAVGGCDEQRGDVLLLVGVCLARDERDTAAVRRERDGADLCEVVLRLQRDRCLGHRSPVAGHPQKSACVGGRRRRCSTHDTERPGTVSVGVERERVRPRVRSSGYGRLIACGGWGRV